MKPILLEEVFKDSGIPSFTFVEPIEYTSTKVAVRTLGKGLIVEGPSGIGKTTSIKKIISELGLRIQPLSARKQEDIELIDLILLNSKDIGIVIIDDFHLLSVDRKFALANLLKTSADENRTDIKLILIGINNAGETLVELSPDLNNRIDTIKYESNPPEKINELIQKGETALNIKFDDKGSLIEKVNGSFHMTQLLCKEMCIMQDIIEAQPEIVHVTSLTSNACKRKTAELARVYEPITRTFVTGTKIRREGRAPYFHLLMWLSQSPDWSVRMDSLYVKHPLYKQSISQVAEKDYLKNLIEHNEGLTKNIHYDERAKILTIEDPKFMFFLRNISWEQLAADIGFVHIEFTNKYDFALSFAGENRDFPQRLNEILLNEYNYNVFYDNNEQAEIFGKNLEKYFEPIYASEADFVIVFLDKYYPKKVWTVFESKQYKERFGEDAILPLIFNDFEISPTDELYNRGYIAINKEDDIDKQMQCVAKILNDKIRLKRATLKYRE